MIGSEELIKYIFNYSLVHKIGLGIHNRKIILKIGIKQNRYKYILHKIPHSESVYEKPEAQK